MIAKFKQLIMELNEFVKTFLPAHDKRLEKALIGVKSSQTIMLIKVGFISSNFEEALQNFANKICDKQKEMCANDAKCKFDNDVFSSSSTSIYSIMDAILNTQLPKIEDL